MNPLKAAFFALIVVAAPAGALAQPVAPASQSGVPVQEVVSPGGVRAWLVSDSTVPIIVLQASWAAGSATEPQALGGVTSVMASMLGEGAGDLDANAFKVRLEELNMGLQFSAGWDFTTMSLTTLTQNRDAAVETARLALRSPRFDQEPLDRIKRQVAVSLRQRETNPNFIANLALDQALIPGHPYASRLTAESLAAISPESLRARRAQIFNRETLMVTAVGDIDAATLGTVLDQLFGGLPTGGVAERAPPATITNAAEVDDLIVRPLPQPQSLILFAAPGIQDEDPDWQAFQVANYILGGGGFSSRLMDEVREERGLVYGIGTGPSVRESAAFLRGSAQTENGDVREAIDVTRSEIARIFADGATAEEVRDAIQYLTGSYALDLDSNVKIAGMLHGNQMAGRPIDYVNQRNALIAAVTLDDVNRVIRRVFDPAQFTFVVVGAPEGLEASPGS